jgi:hypothetical protein
VHNCFVVFRCRMSKVSDSVSSAVKELLLR